MTESTSQSTKYGPSIDDRHLADPIRQLDLVPEALRLRQDETLRREGHTARTLIKNGGLRIVLVEMREGSRLGWHRTTSRISIQVIAGAVSVLVPGTHHLVSAGQLLAIEGEIPHQVEALDHSTFLLTLARGT